MIRCLLLVWSFILFAGCCFGCYHLAFVVCCIVCCVVRRVFFVVFNMFRVACRSSSRLSSVVFSGVPFVVFVVMFGGR